MPVSLNRSTNKSEKVETSLKASTTAHKKNKQNKKTTVVRVECARITADGNRFLLM